MVITCFQGRAISFGEGKGLNFSHRNIDHIVDKNTFEHLLVILQGRKSRGRGSFFDHRARAKNLVEKQKSSVLDQRRPA